jgi:hypothetical protein
MEDNTETKVTTTPHTEVKYVQSQNLELRAFLVVLRQALLMVVAHIEKAYGLGAHKGR